MALVGLGGCSDSTTGGTTDPGGGLSGSVTVEGSDTMVNLGQAWAEAFSEEHPNVMVSVKGGGSGNGIAALINGTIDFANASREMKSEEIQLAESKGIKPIETAVALDGITVVVNPSNGVSGLTLDQLGKIYRGEVANWKDVGGADKGIVLLGRDTSSGTYEYFKEEVVGKGAEHSKSMLNLPSNQAITEEVKGNDGAIGYIGIGYAEKAGAAVKLLSVDGVEPTAESVLSGEYPLSRELHMYSNGEPEGVLKAYIDWILSPAGQAIAEEQGFVNRG